MDKRDASRANRSKGKNFLRPRAVIDRKFNTTQRESSISPRIKETIINTNYAVARVSRIEIINGFALNSLSHYPKTSKDNKF